MHLTENLVGAGLADYDYFIILSHFKGHHMGGFGGAIKNMSVGIASSEGKCLIHSAGASTTDRMLSTTPQKDFQETMAESALSVAQALDGKILYINECFFNWLNRLTNIQSASTVRSLSGLLFHVFGRIAAALISLLFIP